MKERKEKQLTHSRVEVENIGIRMFLCTHVIFIRKVIYAYGMCDMALYCRNIAYTFFFGYNQTVLDKSGNVAHFLDFILNKRMQDKGTFVFNVKWYVGCCGLWVVGVYGQ